MTQNFFYPKIRILNSFPAMYDTCMPTCQILVIYLIVCWKTANLDQNFVKLFLLTPLGGLIPPTLAMRSPKFDTWSDSSGSWLHDRTFQSSTCQSVNLVFWCFLPMSLVKLGSWFLSFNWFPPNFTMFCCKYFWTNRFHRSSFSWGIWTCHQN